MIRAMTTAGAPTGAQAASNHSEFGNLAPNGAKPLRTYRIAGRVANDINDNAFDAPANNWDE
jgi:hypothetical protein